MFSHLSLKKICLALLLIFHLSFFFHRVGFISVDLPRHLLNGRVILETKQIPKTNLYSYTNPDHPTVMHHWAGGVVFYLIEQQIGIVGLQVINILLYLLAFVIMIKLALRITSWEIVFFVGTLSSILITTRTQVRPEVFSYLFFAIYVYILHSFFINKLKKKWLYLLPFIQILWVNIHVFFVLGIGLVGLYGLVDLVKKKSLDAIRQWGTLLSAICVASLVNPYGLDGLLSPFTVMTDTQQFIVENLGVFEYLKHFDSLAYQIFLATLAVCAILLYKNWDHLTIEHKILYTILFLVFGYLGIKMVRTVTLFGYVLAPLLSLLIATHLTHNKKKQSYKKYLVFLSFAIMAVFLVQKNYKVSASKWFNLGIEDGINNPGLFVKENNIKGPILNNFNSGSYLAYYLYPSERVYIDGRSEAYPESFIYTDYIPLENSEEAWDRLDSKYQFNTIFAEIDAQAPEWLDFLTRRKDDSQWVLVYQDKNAVVFVRNDEKNQEIIEKYEIVY